MSMNPNSFDMDQIRLSEEQVAEYMAQRRNGSKSPKKRKPPEARFLQFSIPLLLTLGNAEAPCFVWAMVWALSEAWFTSGIGKKHLNPFPLSIVDIKKWRLHRRQKSRALQFLAKRQLIKIDRTEPGNPKVKLAWV